MAKQGKRAFTDEEVRAIRTSPAFPAELARYYKCGIETIRRVMRRETYFDVPDAPEISQAEIDASLQRIMDEVAKPEEAAQSVPSHDCSGEGCPICEQLARYTGRTAP